jgi:hypothetical protein
VHALARAEQAGLAHSNGRHQKRDNQKDSRIFISFSGKKNTDAFIHEY